LTSATNSSLYRKGRRQPGDDGRHFGLVVDDFGLVIDDNEVARRVLRDADATTLDGGFPDFRDTWGNRVEIVDYDNIQFTKRENVLRGMGVEQLMKNEKAKQELSKKGIAFDQELGSFW
jgi:hypothetical protein